jgi:hypothetical protein
VLDPFDDEMYRDRVTVVAADPDLDAAGAPDWEDGTGGASLPAAVFSPGRSQASSMQPGALGGIDIPTLANFLVMFKSDPGSIQPGQLLIWTHHRVDPVHSPTGTELDRPVRMTATAQTIPPQSRPQWIVPCRRVS